MQYGINIGFIAKTTGMAKAADYVAKAGFTMLDYTPPLMQDDWEPVIKAFKEIGYSGVMNIEYSHGNIPDYLAEDFLRFSYKTVKHLWSL